MVVDGSQVRLQPLRHPSERVPTLVLDLRSGAVSVAKNAPALPDSTPCVLGIIGLVRLGAGSVLAVITKAKRVRCGAARLACSSARNEEPVGTHVGIHAFHAASLLFHVVHRSRAPRRACTTS
jgi:hypothetical protein